jgi:GTP cyclohydrolase I-like protein
MRLNWALDGFAEQHAGTSDVSILLHQAIRAYERRLEVKQSLWQVLSSREQAFGLHATAEHEPDMVERMTVEIANALQRILNPKGVAVIVEAKHLCSDERALRDLLTRYPVFADAAYQ